MAVLPQVLLLNFIARVDAASAPWVLRRTWRRGAVLFSLKLGARKPCLKR